MCIYMYICIHTYIYIHRERDHFSSHHTVVLCSADDALPICIVCIGKFHHMCMHVEIHTCAHEVIYTFA